MSTSRLQCLASVVRKNQESLVNGILFLATLGGEEIFRTVAFNCPCRQPDARQYGVSFVVGPAAVLFLTGLLVSPVMWRLFQGCCCRSEHSQHGCRAATKCCFTQLGRSLVAPSAWFFIVLMDGSYYVCIESSAPCDKDSGENRLLQAKSQFYSWVYLVCFLALSFTVLAVIRCSDSSTYYQERYISLYRDVEQKKLEEKIKEKVETLANENINAVFNNCTQTKEEWDTISKLTLCNAKKMDPLPNRGNNSGPYITALHQLAKEKDRRGYASEKEGDV